MQYLSFRSCFAYYKQFMIWNSIIINLVLLFICLHYFKTLIFTNISYKLGFVIMVIYIIESSFYIYYLTKSQTITFNSKYIFIWVQKKHVKRIRIDCVSEIKRKHYFFMS